MILNKINIRYKACLALSFLLLSLIFTLYRFVSLSEDNINFSSKELIGIKVIRPLYDIINPLIQYKMTYLSPDLAKIDNIKELESKIDKSFDSFASIDPSELEKIQIGISFFREDSKEKLEIQQLIQAWKILKNKFSDKSANSSFISALSELKQNIFALLSYTGDKSNLILDPDLDSYYLMDVFVVRLPSLYDRLDQIGEKSLEVFQSFGSDSLKGQQDFSNLVYTFKKIDRDIIFNEYTTAINEDKNFYGISASLQKNIPLLQQDFQKSSSNLYQKSNNSNFSNKQDLVNFYLDYINYIKELHRIDRITGEELIKLINIRIDHLIKEKNKVTYMSIIGIIISSIFSYMIIELLVVNPINKLCSIMTKIMQGNFNIKIPYLKHKDEIGNIAIALEQLKESLKENQHLVEQGKLKEIEQIEEIERRSNLEKIIGHFKNEFSNIVEFLGNSSNNLTETLKGLNTIVSVSNEKADQSLEYSSVIIEKIQPMNSLCNNISSALEEINIQIGKSNIIVNDTADNTNKIDETVITLTQHTAEINAILDLINQISSQINLLALNAHIEASRAGEHGKGFAVVAYEVKALANQSAKAAETISHKVSNITKVSNDVVESLDQLKNSVKDLNTIFFAMSESIAEQTNAATNINKNMNEVSNSVNYITRNIKEVHSSFVNVKDSTDLLNQHVVPINKNITSLNNELDSFINQIRIS